MQKKFQKHKNKILMLAVWLSLFWADFSLAQNYYDESYYNEEMFTRGLSEPTIMEIIIGISNWIFIIIFFLGAIGVCVSVFHFTEDYFNRRKIFEQDKTANTAVEYKKPRSKYPWSFIVSVFLVISSVLGFMALRFVTSMFQSLYGASLYRPKK